MDFGRKLDKSVTGLKGECGDVFDLVSGDVWSILIDQVEMEAYDKVKMVPKMEGVFVHGIMYC